MTATAARPSAWAPETPHPFLFLNTSHQDRDLLVRRAAPASDSSQLGLRELCHDLTRGLELASVLTGALRQNRTADEPLAALEQLLEDLREMVLRSVRTTAPHKVDLRTVARAVCADIALGFHGTVELDAPRAVLACGDPVLLQRAFSNVLSASCQAAESGRVRVRVTSERGRARIEVHDDAGAHDQQAEMALWIAQAVMATSDGRLALERGEQGHRCISLDVPLAVPA